MTDAAPRTSEPQGIDPRQVEYLPLGSLQADPRNPKAHHLETIDESIGRFGMLDLIVRDGRTGYIISGHGRRKALAGMAERGEMPPEGVKIDPDSGEWLVPVVAGWSSRTDSEAAAALIALNRTTELGGWVDDELLGLLDQLADEDGGLEGVGYDEADIEALRHSLAELEDADELREQYRTEPSAKPTRRTTHLDLIFSTSAATSPIALIGYALGWNPGIITTAANAARKYVERFPRGKPIMFMDNEWHGYDHAQHLAALAEFTPKYATVRDLVTRRQADEAGIEYYSIEETLGMAEEVAQHTENVILIPKYDCLDKLPSTVAGKRVVLGYSVESSYGGTPVPISKFAGRPVHLLGGSWKRQRALLEALRDDVVSLDNNNMLMVSRFASVNLVGGGTSTLDEVVGRISHNHMTLSVVLSLANVIDDVIDNFGVEVETGSQAEILGIDEAEEHVNDR